MVEGGEAGAVWVGNLRYHDFERATGVTEILATQRCDYHWVSVSNPRLCERIKDLFIYFFNA